MDDDVVPSMTVKRLTACGNMYVTFLFEDSKIVRIFPQLGKSGECSMAIMDMAHRAVDAMRGHTISLAELGLGWMNVVCPKKSVVANSCVHELGMVLRETAMILEGLAGEPDPLKSDVEVALDEVIDAELPKDQSDR